jgi:hypothetical protein
VVLKKKALPIETSNQEEDQDKSFLNQNKKAFSTVWKTLFLCGFASVFLFIQI